MCCVFNRRAGYAAHTLWATRYSPEERFPAGEYPNQDPTMDAGLPQWASQDRGLVDEDLVLWHVFGAHHIPRLEDWPLMPAERVSCVLKPFGFFDACPVLDVAPTSKRQLRLSISNNAHQSPAQASSAQAPHEHVLVQSSTTSGGDPCCQGTSTSSGGGGPQAQEGMVLKSRL